MSHGPVAFCCCWIKGAYTQRRTYSTVQRDVRRKEGRRKPLNRVSNERTCKSVTGDRQSLDSREAPRSRQKRRWRVFESQATGDTSTRPLVCSATLSHIPTDPRPPLLLTFWNCILKIIKKKFFKARGDCYCLCFWAELLLRLEERNMTIIYTHTHTHTWIKCSCFSTLLCAPLLLYSTLWWEPLPLSAHKHITRSYWLTRRAAAVRDNALIVPIDSWITAVPYCYHSTSQRTQNEATIIIINDQIDFFHTFFFIRAPLECASLWNI